MNVWLKNLQELCDAVKLAWTRIPKEYFQHLVEPKLQRIQALKEAKGGPT